MMGSGSGGVVYVADGVADGGGVGGGVGGCKCLRCVCTLPQTLFVATQGCMPQEWLALYRLMMVNRYVWPSLMFCTLKKNHCVCFLVYRSPLRSNS